MLRPLFFAIIDEVDSILIDEARTPLIISGSAERATDRYAIINRIIPLFNVRLITEEDEIQANEFGKATMAAEVLAVALLILNWPAGSVSLGQAALGGAILLSLVSGVAYFHKFWRRINLAK